MSSGFYNVGSLVLGLLAWGVPVLAVNKGWRNGLPHVASMGLCGLSLCFQMFEADHRIKLGDFSALMDTWGAVTWVGVVLLAVTVGLNLLLACANRREDRRHTPQP